MSKIYYRGQMLFLYVQFKDEKNNYLDVSNPAVNITYEKNGELVYLLKNQSLSELFPNSNEYIANVTLPNNIDYSIYDIEYFANFDVDKIARVNETFHVIPRSEIYTNAVKVYGYIHQARVGYPLISSTVRIESLETNVVVSESYTNLDGKWEAYIYPGDYKFIFEKYGFEQVEIIVQIGDQHNEIQFDNVTLESESFAKKGNGVYTISDKYVTREGVPLVGLSINAINVLNLQDTNPPQDVTNNDGEWQLFLDPGTYLLRVNGNSLMEDFNQTFRLRVEEDGKFTFENLTENIGIPVNEPEVGRGSGVEQSDYVIDANGNGIVDVQVCVYPKGNINQLVAQDYTDPMGKWTVYLQPGTYVFEFYHPEFHEFSEERTVK